MSAMVRETFKMRPHARMPRCISDTLPGFWIEEKHRVNHWMRGNECFEFGARPRRNHMTQAFNFLEYKLIWKIDDVMWLDAL
jgi:hypothetical protein